MARHINFIGAMSLHRNLYTRYNNIYLNNDDEYFKHFTSVRKKLRPAYGGVFKVKSSGGFVTRIPRDIFRTSIYSDNSRIRRTTLILIILENMQRRAETRERTIATPRETWCTGKTNRPPPRSPAK